MFFTGILYQDIQQFPSSSSKQPPHIHFHSVHLPPLSIRTENTPNSLRLDTVWPNCKRGQWTRIPSQNWFASYNSNRDGLFLKAIYRECFKWPSELSLPGWRRFCRHPHLWSLSSQHIIIRLSRRRFFHRYVKCEYPKNGWFFPSHLYSVWMHLHM